MAVHKQLFHCLRGILACFEWLVVLVSAKLVHWHLLSGGLCSYSWRSHTFLMFNLCRLKAALRRLDVRDADEFDEEEYRAASEAVRQQTQAIVQVGALWQAQHSRSSRQCCAPAAALATQTQ